MTSYRGWLNQQTHRDDPVGDLARDVKRDDCARYIRTPDGLFAHLTDMHDPSGDAMQAFLRSVDEWVAA